MKSSTYEIAGCQGSRIYKQLREFECMPDARRAAHLTNKRVADCLGISFRAYKKSNSFSEGWTVAGKSGYDGSKA